MTSPLVAITCYAVKIIKYQNSRRLGVNDQANYVYSQAITAQMCVNSPRIRVANLAYEVILDLPSFFFLLLLFPSLTIFLFFFHHILAKPIPSILCKNFRPNCGGKNEINTIHTIYFEGKIVKIVKIFFFLSIYFSKWLELIRATCKLFIIVAVRDNSIIVAALITRDETMKK